MNIKRIEVANFKSFEELNVDLNDFNILIGANASGKSNFVQIFQFIKNISNFGLDNAVSMHGGVEYLRNINIGPSKDLSIKVFFDKEFKLPLPVKNELIEIKTYDIYYGFALKFEKGDKFKITKENLTLKYKLIKLNKQMKKIKAKEIYDEGEIALSRVNGIIKIKAKDEIKKLFPFLSENFLTNILAPETLLLRSPFFLFLVPIINIFQSIKIYYFDPKLAKKAALITGKTELEEDGANLSIILKNILENKKKKRKFFNLVKELLPFINNLDVEKFMDLSLLFKSQEIYSKNQYLPASSISDGTINIIALIIALYFEEKPLTIIEEPEKNIHPYLISKVVNMMKEASQNKQILVTTHNPEIVKYTDLDNILLVSRNENGFTTISRPVDKKEVKIFLKNNIGIEELYIQNLLGI
ncbi:MAG TPA: AAA family ATPase [Caldisericia bacterium]|nr:AAA family ATPase [Caldisericia bacterium]HPB33577.1 AAA family ATPase [Caldisericia bacterium]HQL65935.1 AAA family ATPase [Caldisericia bacterium]HQN48665.1 AAA family ATPase [Caldisericia bacterium]HQP00180.1 AAA family ATPase [Caldisericia bacterium]